MNLYSFSVSLDMKKITTSELYQRLESGPVAVFDVRGDGAYEMGHIPGAKTAPMGSLVFRVASIMNPDSFIVLYSAGGRCRLADEAAIRLENMGLVNVHVYEEGVQGWLSAGHDLVPSPHARLQAQGPAVNCRHLVVNTQRAYGGAFMDISDEVAGAGG